MGGKGSGGHNKKPSKTKSIEGNRGHRTKPANEPTCRAGEPAIPKYLNARACRIWNELVPKLIEMQLLTLADGPALGLLCSSLAQVELCEGAIEKYGLICSTLDQKTGVANLKANPAVRVKADAMRQARAALARFGLDPASRVGLTVADLSSPKKDAIEKLMEESEADEVVN